MERRERTEQLLTHAATLQAVEGMHRQNLKRQLMRQATEEKEEWTMGNFRKILAYATCAALVVGLAAGATSTYFFLNVETGRPVITSQGPVEAARTVFNALQSGDFSITEKIFPTKEQLATIFPSASPFVARYDELKAKLRGEFDQCRKDYPNLSKAELVRVDGDYAMKPAPGGGPGQIEGYDNAHIFVLMGDMVYDIRLDELLKIGGSWYFVELPGKAGAGPPIPIRSGGH